MCMCQCLYVSEEEEEEEEEEGRIYSHSESVSVCMCQCLYVSKYVPCMHQCMCLWMLILTLLEEDTKLSTNKQHTLSHTKLVV